MRAPPFSPLPPSQVMRRALPPPPLQSESPPLLSSQVMRGMHLLQSGLDGADIYQMIMRDPRLLFLPELEKGITQLRWERRGAGRRGVRTSTR